MLKNNNFKPNVMIFIAPSFLLALFIIAYPIYDLIKLSLMEVGSFGDIKGFTGLLNYQQMFEDPLFVDVVIRTIIFTIASGIWHYGNIYTNSNSIK